MRDFAKLGKKIICIGRNYPSHIAERGASTPSKPFFFLKPTTAYCVEPAPIRLPEGLLVEHEVELGVVIGRTASNVTPATALNYVAGYCLALDLTARDLQKQAAAAGLPWSMAKGYDTFCPVSAFIPKMSIRDPHTLPFWLKVNDIIKQEGHTKDMIFKVPEIIAEISQCMRLQEGDLILTGTPSGVGPIKVGDILFAGLGHDHVKMKFKVAPRPKTSIYA